VAFFAAPRTLEGAPVPVTRSFAFLVVAVVFVLSQGCAPAMQVTRLAPSTYNLGNTKRVAVLEVTGDRRAVDQVINALQHRIIDDRYYSLVVATDRGATFAVTALGGLIEIGEVRQRVEADVYVKAHVSRYEYEELPKEENKVARYQPEAHVTINFQVVKNDGRVVVFRDYMANQSGTAFDSGKKPNRAPADLLDDGVRSAVSNFADDITPHTVVDRIVFDDADALLKPGIKKAQDGDLAGAERDWLTLLSQNPNNAGALYNIGVLLETRGEFEQAAAHYNQAIELFGKPLYREALDNMNRRLAEAQSLNQGI
jgi:hypothetical protein